MDDWLRCHAMHFEGSIRDLVTPVDTHGPWRLLDSKLTDQPAIPCLACHQMHRYGAPLARPAVKADDAGPREEISRTSLAFFDGREQDYVSLASLPLRGCAMAPALSGSAPTSARLCAISATPQRPAVRSAPATTARRSESTKASVASRVTKSTARKHAHPAQRATPSFRTADSTSKSWIRLSNRRRVPTTSTP